MAFEVRFRHALMAAFAFDIIMQTSLFVVFSLDGLPTAGVFAFDHGISAVDVNVVLHLASLDLRFATIFALGTLDVQVVEDIDENLGR